MFVLLILLYLVIEGEIKEIFKTEKTIFNAEKTAAVRPCNNILILYKLRG